MTDPDEEAERRIAELEVELAQLQAASVYQQVEANLVRQRLKETLDIAMHVIDRLSVGFEANVERMAEDLNGGAGL